MQGKFDLRSTLTLADMTIDENQENEEKMALL